MDLLLKCNQRLVSSSLDAGLVLQQTLITIVEKSDAALGLVEERVMSNV
jgi:hypothetical protein